MDEEWSPWRSPAGMERIWWAFLLPPLVFGLVIGFKLFTASSDRVVEGDPGRPFYLATEHNMDGFVIRTGEPSDHVPPAVQAAACRSYGDWLDQIATSPDVVIVDDPGLLRSAQLLAGDVYRGEDVTAEVERLLIDEDGDPARALDRLAEDDWSHQARETASAYLDDREMDPSPGVEDRYVTYMVPSGLTSVLFVRLEIDPDAEKVSRTPNRIRAIGVQLPDGSVVSVRESTCWR